VVLTYPSGDWGPGELAECSSEVKSVWSSWRRESVQQRPSDATMRSVTSASRTTQGAMPGAILGPTGGVDFFNLALTLRDQAARRCDRRFRTGCDRADAGWARAAWVIPAWHDG
jgi:hypothetical protein